MQNMEIQFSWLREYLEGSSIDELCISYGKSEPTIQIAIRTAMSRIKLLGWQCKEYFDKAEIPLEYEKHADFDYPKAKRFFSKQFIYAIELYQTEFRPIAESISKESVWN